MIILLNIDSSEVVIIFEVDLKKPRRVRSVSGGKNRRKREKKKNEF